MCAAAAATAIVLVLDGVYQSLRLSPAALVSGVRQLRPAVVLLASLLGNYILVVRVGGGETQLVHPVTAAARSVVGAHVQTALAARWSAPARRASSAGEVVAAVVVALLAPLDMVIVLSCLPVAWRRAVGVPLLAWLYSWIFFRRRGDSMATASVAGSAAFFEKNWPFFLGFGLPYSLVTFALSPISAWRAFILTTLPAIHAVTMLQADCLAPRRRIHYWASVLPFGLLSSPEALVSLPLLYLPQAQCAALFRFILRDQKNSE